MAASLSTVVARPNVQSNGYSGSQTNNGNSLLACGLVVYETAAQTPAMSWSAAAMAGQTQYKDGASHSSAQWFLKTAPAAGAQTLAVTGLSSDRQGIFYAPINGATDTLRDSDGTAGTGVTSLSRTVTTEPGDLILGTVGIASFGSALVGTGDFAGVVVSEGFCPDFLYQGNAAFVATGTSHTVGFSWTGAANASLAVIVLASAGATAVATGTMTTPPIVRADIVAGGKTIILTLTGDTWVASGATFDAQRQNIINGLDAANSTANGWNEVVRDTMAVTAVVRTSATVVTITLPAFASYAPSATQTITCTIPASALVLATEVVATPTIVTLVGPLLSAYSGTTNGSGVVAVTLTSDDALTANGEVLALTGAAGGATSRATDRPT